MKTKPFCAAAFLIFLSSVSVKSELAPQRAAELFATTHVWSAHFTFAPAQWTALEPKSDALPFAGPRPQQRDVFGPGMFLAPAFLATGDANKDHKLSEEEFTALGAKWFAQWDINKRGKLNADQIKAGLTLSFAPPRPDGATRAIAPEGRPRGPGLLGAEGKRNGLSAAAGIQFDFVEGQLDFAGKSFANVAVRYKGNGTFMQSRGSEKRSLKVDLDKFEKGQKLANNSTLNFHNNVTDASWMNEVLSYRLFRDAGVPAPRTAFVRVSVTVPGKFDRKYLGLYSLVENPDRNFADEVFGTKKGAIFKPVTPHLFADLGDDWKAYNQIYDAKTALTSAQKQRIIDFAKLVTHAADTEFAARLGEFLDIDAFARFMAVTVWLSTLDSILGPGQNYYLHLHPKTNTFQFVPWDLDHSFGHFFLMGTQEQRENLSIHKPWRGENRFLDRIFKVEAFKKEYLDRLREFSETIFRPERFHQQIDELASAIRESIAEESAEKLVQFEKAVGGDSVALSSAGGDNSVQRPGNAGGTAERSSSQRERNFPMPPGFPPVTKSIRQFVAARAGSVLAQLAGKSDGQTLDDARAGARFGEGPGFGAGNFLWRPFMTALDGDKDGELTAAECTEGFHKWFQTWKSPTSDSLDEDHLRAGLNAEFRPPGGAVPR